MATEDEYKGYSIRYSSHASTPAVAPYSPTTFLVCRKRGEDREVVHTGEVRGTFRSPQDAFQAAHTAARRWIDEHGQQ
jgi:hypothetical protein